VSAVAISGSWDRQWQDSLRGLTEAASRSSARDWVMITAWAAGTSFLDITRTTGQHAVLAEGYGKFGSVGGRGVQDPCMVTAVNVVATCERRLN